MFKLRTVTASRAGNRAGMIAAEKAADAVRVSYYALHNLALPSDVKYRSEGLPDVTSQLNDLMRSNTDLFASHAGDMTWFENNIGIISYSILKSKLVGIMPMSFTMVPFFPVMLRVTFRTVIWGRLLASPQQRYVSLLVLPNKQPALDSQLNANGFLRILVMYREMSAT